MKRVRLLSLLLLGVVVLTGWGCREEDVLFQPSVAYVGDVIEIKVKVFYDDYNTYPPHDFAAVRFYIQIPNDWQLLSLESKNNILKDFTIRDSKSPDGLKTKRGYKWIEAYTDSARSKFTPIVVNTELAIKTKIGNSPKWCLLDYFANVSFMAPSNNDKKYKALNVPIYIYDQKAEIEINPPCSYQDKAEVFFNYENRGASKNVDIYLVMLDPEGDFYSYPDWQSGILPFLQDFSIPQNTKIENVKIFDISYPSDYPPIVGPGYYTFFFATAKPGTSTITGEIVSNKYFVGNENPIPDLQIWGRQCETLPIEFDASRSWDFCDKDDELLIRFDFEGDGIWDTDYQTNKIEHHIYDKPGYYKPTIELKDTSGLISNYQTWLFLYSRLGNWSVERDYLWKEGDYFNFEITPNKIQGSYKLTWSYADPPSYFWEETKEGNFEVSNYEEYFRLDLDWGYMYFEFESCDQARIKVYNSDDYLLYGRERDFTAHVIY